jgi:hypothetical protein
MPLHNNTARQLINELRSARQELAVLRAIADTVQAFQMALGAEPPRRGAGPDVVWQAEREMEQEEAPSAREDAA